MKIALTDGYVSVLEIARIIRDNFKADVTIELTDNDDISVVHFTNMEYLSDIRVYENGNYKDKFDHVTSGDYTVIEYGEGDDKEIVSAVLNYYGGWFVTDVKTLTTQEFFNSLQQ